MKDCVSCVHEYLPPMSDTCRECGIAMLNYEEAKPKRITNYDLIRSKSVEEMAEFLTLIMMGEERSVPFIYSTVDRWLDWLKQEANHD